MWGGVFSHRDFQLVEKRVFRVPEAPRAPLHRDTSKVGENPQGRKFQPEIAKLRAGGGLGSSVCRPRPSSKDAFKSRFLSFLPIQTKRAL